MINKETGEPTDRLSQVVEKMAESLGSVCTTVSGLIASRDRAVFATITEGLDRANSAAPTEAHKVNFPFNCT